MQTYAPTENLLKLAARAPAMRCFCFISTAFVNANMPNGSVVEEKIYPLLQRQGTRWEEAAIGRHLLDMDLEAAEAEVRHHALQGVRL